MEVAPPAHLESPSMVVSDDLQALFGRLLASEPALRAENVATRIERLRRLREALLAYRSRLQDALYADFGRPREETDLSDILTVLLELRHAIRHLRHWMRARPVSTPLLLLGTRSEIRPEPKGVSLIMAPWNYPVNLTLGPLVGAIGAGCPAIVKPSEYTPHTSAVIQELIQSAFPDHEVAVVEGDVRVAERLLRLPFRHIYFTGSPQVGRIIMRAAATHLTSVTLELGGKSPVVVDASADLRRTAERIATGKWINAGQTCIAPDHVFVHRSVHAELTDLLRNEISRRYGVTSEDRERSPSLARAAHPGHFDRLSALYQDAIARGARAEIGGAVNPESRFVDPTILSGVPPEADVMTEEIFGPILPIIAFDTIDEAIRAINARPFPLALYVFALDQAVVDRVLAQTTAGGSVVNDTVIHFAHSELPFGGVGESGFGKGSGQSAFDAFSNDRAIVRQRWRYSPLRLVAAPYGKRARTIIDMAIGFYRRF